MRDVIADGRANIIFREMSKNRVGLVWPKAVTSCSPAKLLKSAKKVHANFEISGAPLGLADEEDEDVMVRGDNEDGMVYNIFDKWLMRRK